MMIKWMQNDGKNRGKNNSGEMMVRIMVKWDRMMVKIKAEWCKMMVKWGEIEANDGAKW